MEHFCDFWKYLDHGGKRVDVKCFEGAEVNMLCRYFNLVIIK